MSEPYPVIRELNALPHLTREGVHTLCGQVCRGWIPMQADWVKLVGCCKRCTKKKAEAPNA